MAKMINLFAGPGSGKSTTAAGVFFIMKSLDLKCELVTEYAKDLTYEGNMGRLKNQVHVTGEQVQRINRVIDTVDYVVTDSPFLLSICYTPDNYPKGYTDFCIEYFKKYDNKNFLIKRKKPFQQYGRNENEEEARKKDDDIELMLRRNNIDFSEVDGDFDAPIKIVEEVLFPKSSALDGIVGDNGFMNIPSELWQKFTRKRETLYASISN